MMRHDSFEHVQNDRGLSDSVQSHGDATTNLLWMYHGLSQFLKSWTIRTTDRDSVTEA